MKIFKHEWGSNPYIAILMFVIGIILIILSI